MIPLFLKDDKQITIVLQAIDTFSKVSDLFLHFDKCELLPAKHCPYHFIQNIAVKQNVTYLLIYITKNLERHLENLINKLVKCKNIYNLGLQRDLTIVSGILLTKVDGISRVLPPTYSLALDPSFIKAVDQQHFNFIWNNKTHNFLKKQFCSRLQTWLTKSH